jgi:hypothetical protein
MRSPTTMRRCGYSAHAPRDGLQKQKRRSPAVQGARSGSVNPDAAPAALGYGVVVYEDL